MHDDRCGDTAWQYGYEPYGEVVLAEADANQPATPAVLVHRIGHQGLFFERFLVDPNDTFNSPALDPNAVGVYLTRNRAYSPRLGRWLSRDMNESAQPVVTALSMNGLALDAVVEAFRSQGQYGDGLNLYLAFGCNPLTKMDPPGLWTLPEIVQGANYAAGYAVVAGMNFAQGHALAFRFVGGVLAAANLYAMATDPDYAELVMSTGGYAVLQADLKAILSTGGSILGMLRNPKATASIARLGGVSWQAAEEWLTKTFGGHSQYGFRTSLGRRVVDTFADNTIMEAKTGFVAYSGRIMEQIEKDKLIMREFPQVRRAVWHFFKSDTTGKLGADQRVFDALRGAGIEVVFHE